MEVSPVTTAPCVPIPASSRTFPSASPNPWALSVNTSSPPCSLQDVMDNELAHQLQSQEMENPPKQEENRQHYIEGDHLMAQLLQDTSAGNDVTNDHLMAQLLQREFDEEHNKQLKREEEKFNRSSTVKISFENYRVSNSALADEDGDEGTAQPEVWEEEEQSAYVPQFSRGGISGKGKNIITKHDRNISSKRNADKFINEGPLEYDIGDSKSMDLRLPNEVYNRLKSHVGTENKRRHRVHERKDERSTAEEAVDRPTRLVLYKLVNGSVLEAVNGIISSGKEAVVLHAIGGRIEGQTVPKECAVKVFKTTLGEFKNRCQYVKGDVRFFKDEFKKQNPRKIMKIWANKEEINLRRMQRCGVNSPQVVLLKKHVLVMSFIGDNRQAAPKLKDAVLTSTQAQHAYQQCIDNMKKMYRGCGLVHADLSEYNMLWYNDTLYLIDVGQAVDRMHPHAHEFLLRDCTNVCQFFTKIGVNGVTSPCELFNEITELNLEGTGNDLLMQIEQYEKNEAKLSLGNSLRNYPFDFFFDLSSKQNASKSTLLSNPGHDKATVIDDHDIDKAANSDDSDDDDDDENDDDDFADDESWCVLHLKESLKIEEEKHPQDDVKNCDDDNDDDKFEELQSGVDEQRS